MSDYFTIADGTCTGGPRGGGCDRRPGQDVSLQEEEGPRHPEGSHGEIPTETSRQRGNYYLNKHLFGFNA